jgi:deazaflavin-dependent oxidoreductase (nitroreductase family)
VSAPLAFADANAVQRALRQVVATPAGAWVAIRALDHVDKAVFRATGGRHTASSALTGLPLVFLTTRGARSGRPRTVPLLGLPTSEGLAVVASNFGQGHHPAWYHNLRAHPEAEALIDGRRTRVRAVPVEGQRRERIWREGLEVYPGWTSYERRATNRRIVVFVLEPVQDAAGASQ